MMNINISNGLFIDPNDKATAIVFGSGIRSSKSARLGADTLDSVSQTGAQDVPVIFDGFLNDLIFGCLTSACSGGNSEGDIAINAQTAQAVRIANNAQDEFWVNGNGFVGGVPVAAMATPTAPTVTPACPACSNNATWGYKVCAVDANGGLTPCSTETQIVNTQNATLDGTHFNVITWTEVIGAKSYKVFRSTAATTPATTGIIGTVASTWPSRTASLLTFTDNAVAGDSSSAQATNTTGTLALASTSGAIKNVAGTATMGMTLKKGTGSGNYTTASTTYVHVGASELCDTVTIPAGWKLGIVVNGALGTATGAVVANLAISDNATCTTDNAGILVETTETTTAAATLQAIGLACVIAGDGASHNVALQFKTSNGADSATILNSSATSLPTVVYTLLPSN